jgi:hypothetical protein
MAHFAQLDENNNVVAVLVVDNADIQNLPFPESEAVGQSFLATVLPDVPQDRWVQTSYNSNFRVRYAGIGYQFIPSTAAAPHGGFAEPKIADNFVFDDSICTWVPPIPRPTDGKNYEWDFSTAQWRLSRYQVPVGITTIGE